MSIYSQIIANREFFMLAHTLIIGLICFIIVLKTDKLFRLSLHQGIRYFRNAFFFFGLAFISRYLLGTTPITPSVLKIVFEFFLLMAGFSLLYSLLWKRLEKKRTSISSLFNIKIGIFYLIALIIVTLDFLWGTYNFMFASQIIVFTYASIISAIKYKQSKTKKGFLKFYFLVMVLNLAAWIMNLIIATTFQWNRIGVINIYLLNLIIFIVFFYGVILATQKNKKS